MQISLHEHFENYINECLYVRRLRPASIKSSKDAYKQFLKIVPEITCLSDVSPELVTVFFKRLQERERIVGKDKIRKGVKDATVAHYANRLKTFFQWLKQHRHINDNPFETLKLPKPVFVDKRALSGEDIKKIMGAVVQGASNSFLLRRDISIIGILTFCGIRRNELVSLEVRDIDLYGGYICVRPETSKSKRFRKIPINPYLKMHLIEYLDERKKRGCKTEFLFVSNLGDRPLTLHGLKHWVERIRKSSGVKLHLHRFRHTFATNLAMQDVGVIKIQKLMGHSGIAMTQTYLRSVRTEDLQDDINKLSFENLA
ncbi:MAG: tyrosine-type recombinase/integrase [Bacteroidetes bacterium]|nr:tyrosine-type recombinase/integrase [Bacteroidota bacterium]